MLGSNINGYFVDFSGEVFNFLVMYHFGPKVFDTSGVQSIKTFVTDSSYGNFDVSINNLPPVTFLQLTDGHDIFTNRPNKNTFE